MSEILGYGEDALTLWALKHRISEILHQLDDPTQPTDCRIFYRPSFGRHSRGINAVFGEFDAIITSSRNVYLIESKWDNLAKAKDGEIKLRKEQMLRHQIFTWYLTHWNESYFGKWAEFAEKQRHSFKFERKTIAHPKRLLAKNLEFVLNAMLKHCKAVAIDNIKNVLLFFYKETKPSIKTDETFTLVQIDYGTDALDSFIPLFP